MRLLRRMWLIALVAMATTAAAQRVGVSTNGLYWLTATPNASLHLRMSDKISVNLDVMGRPRLGFDKLNVKGFAISPEVRFWLSRHTYTQHFVGGMITGADYSGWWGDHGHKGQMVAIGATYGYDWVLTKRLNLEVTAGVGVGLARDLRDVGKGNMTAKNHIFPAPLKLGVNLIYLIR